MKKGKLAVIISLVCLTGLTVQAQIIESWDFTGTNGSGLPNGVNGTSLLAPAQATIQGNRARITSDNTDNLTEGAVGATVNAGDIFRAPVLSGAPITTGIVQMSLNLSGDLTTTDTLADGDGRLQFMLRDNTNSDVGGVRMRFDSLGGATGEFALDVSDSLVDNTSVATFAGNTLTDLNLRAVYDLDNKGSAGSFQVYYQLGVASEVLAYNGTLSAAAPDISRLRWVAQMDNGGTNWAGGDFYEFDDLVISQVPEPTTYALLALTGFGLCWTLRRRK